MFHKKYEKHINKLINDKFKLKSKLKTRNISVFLVKIVLLLSNLN